jgi:hypothetical protein
LLVIVQAAPPASIAVHASPAHFPAANADGAAANAAAAIKTQTLLTTAFP